MAPSRPRPPRLPAALLRRLIPGLDADALVGDLDEQFTAAIRTDHEVLRARARYWEEFLRSLMPLIRQHFVAIPSPIQPRFPETSSMQRLSFALHQAFRSLSADRVFALSSCGLLALGTTATTLIMALTYGVLLAPLPYPDADELVRVGAETSLSSADAVALAEAVEGFDRLATYNSWGYSLIGDGAPEQIRGARVSVDFFAVLGVRPALGRLFEPADDASAAAPVVLLSDSLWRRRFDADPEIVGKTIGITSSGFRNATVVGVLPADHRALERDWEVWAPQRVDSSDAEQFAAPIRLLIGRLARTSNAASVTAQARLALQQRWDSQGQADLTSRVASLSVRDLRQTIGAEATPILASLTVAVGLVFVVALANLVSLQLIRRERQQNAIAVRTALGATRPQIVSWLAAEGLLLGAGAALLTVAMVIALWNGLVAALPHTFPRLAELALLYRYIVAGVAAAVASGLLLGLTPARTKAQPAGRTPSRGVSGARPRTALLVAEVAISMTLLAGASLMARTLWSLTSLDPGFANDGVTSVYLYASGEDYADAGTARRFFARVRERLAALPGIDDVGLSHLLPLSPDVWTTGYQAGDDDPRDPRPRARIRMADEGYFNVYRIPLLSGRTFSREDTPSTPAAAVINEALAAELPWESPIGRHLPTDWGRFEIVGVVGSIRQNTLDAAPAPEVHVLPRQLPFAISTLYVNILAAPGYEPSADEIRVAVWSVDPNVPVSRFARATARVRESTADRRMLGALLTGFAAAAMALAAIGIYAVTAYAVTTRRREFAIRLALGASPSSISRAALVETRLALGVGLLIGGVGSWAAGRALVARLYQVSGADVPTFVIAALPLIGAALIAAWMPARHASRTDPARALRAD